MDPQEINNFSRSASGLMGSVAAMLWIRDTWPRRVGYVLAGAMASHYAAPHLARWSSTDEALAGFLVGLFSMALAAKVFETLEAMQASQLLDRLLRRIGL
jgi:hypothetical protein